jgi:hypothetical protein
MTARRPSLPRLLKKWQRKLRLMDWEITISYGTPEQLGSTADNTVYGQCRPQRQHRSAEILVLDPSHFSPDAPAHYTNVELTLVHELCHIVCEPVFDKVKLTKENDLAQEVIVETFAKALLEL